MKTLTLTLMTSLWFCLANAFGQATPPPADSDADVRRLLEEAYARMAADDPTRMTNFGALSPGASNALPNRAQSPDTLTQPTQPTPTGAFPTLPLPDPTPVIPADVAAAGQQPTQPPPTAPPSFPAPPAPGPAPGVTTPTSAAPGGGPPAPSAAPDPNAVQTLSALDDPDSFEDDQVLAPGVIRFQDADLLQVLDVYQELTGRTVLRPAQLPAQKISIRSQTPLTRREAVQALDSILALNEITMIPQGEKFVQALPSATAATGAGNFVDLDAEVLPESGSFVTHVIQLKNAVPSEATQALQQFAKLPNSILAIDSTGILVLRDYAANVKRMVELVEKIDVVAIKQYEPIVIPIKYALAADIAQVLGSLTSGGATTTVGSQQANTGLTGPTGGLGTQPGGTNPFNRNQQQQQQQGLGGAAGGLRGGRSSFQDRLRNIVSRAAQGEIAILGETQIIADERTNSLLIFASKSDIDTIQDIIDKLDVVLQQVIIDSLIMEVSLGDSLDYGFSYIQRSKNLGGATGAGGIINRGGNITDPSSLRDLGSNGVGNLASGFNYFLRFNDDFDMAMSAVATDSRINVLSRPRIQTSHAVEANLFVGRTRPYVTGTYFGFSGQPQSQFQQQQIGITLSVLPLINPEGLVVMDIRQKIQAIGQEIAIDQNFSVPETIDREANAKVAVRDRETVILGGFISSDSSETRSGVPILKDIPLIGALFRGTSTDKDRTELIVMIRPTVLPTPEEAALVAREEKSMMPGIVAAERDWAKAEEARQRKTQEELFKREGFSKN